MIKRTMIRIYKIFFFWDPLSSLSFCLEDPFVLFSACSISSSMGSCVGMTPRLSIAAAVPLICLGTPLSPTIIPLAPLGEGLEDPFVLFSACSMSSSMGSCVGMTPRLSIAAAVPLICLGTPLLSTIIPLAPLGEGLKELFFTLFFWWFRLPLDDLALAFSSSPP
jgi:hypothetical protein